MAGVYWISNAYYNLKQWREYVRLRQAVSLYFDRGHSELIRWMNTSMLLLAIVGLCVPVLIFILRAFQPYLLIISVTALAYTAVTFSLYTVTDDAVKTLHAEQYAEEEQLEETVSTTEQMDAAVLQAIERKMKAWCETEAYLNSAVSVGDILETTHVSPQNFRQWLKATGKGNFQQWLSQLRVEHAKKLLIAHPEWTIDAVAAESCFTDRANFNRAFRRITGMSPTEWIESGKEE